MICKKCNFENEATAKFCENCGANLQGIKNPMQANKPLMKVIIGCIVLLYVLVALAYLESKRYEYSYMYRPTFIYLLSVIMLVTVVILKILKKIKLSFGITAILLSIYPLLFLGTIDFTSLIVVFFLATITTLIYKYSFAENQK